MYGLEKITSRQYVPPALREIALVNRVKMMRNVTIDLPEESRELLLA